MLLIWPYTATTDPFEHQRNLQPGETRRRLARAKYEEEITMYTHQHLFDAEIKAKHLHLANEALRASQLREAYGEQPGRIAALATSLRRSLGTILIATGERLHPAEPRAHREKRPDRVMQA